MGEMNRDSVRRLATGEHQCGCSESGKREVWLGSPAPPVLGRQVATFSVLTSPARRPEHVMAAANQPSVQSMARSSNPHGTALSGLVGVAVNADDAARAPSPTISIRESDPAKPAERGLLDCFLLARNGPLGHVGRPDELPALHHYNRLDSDEQA